MMKIMTKLDTATLDMIDGYRYNYCGNENYDVNVSNLAPSAEILKEWATQKSDHLFALMNEELIISKKITFEKSISELSDEIDKILMNDYVDKHGRSAHLFYTEWYRFINRSSFSYRQDCCLRTLMGHKALASNIYNGRTFEITDPTGKVHKIVHGCKVSRALGRLAKAFNLEHYEDFRICHSQVLNQRTLTGTLNLSIHPLDYMTMSDNECHWDSCMSWRNEGSFRQGTVEMMNSPTVVVAYLSSDSVHMEIPNYSTNTTSKWNSKKWRSLFVIDKNAIVSVKDYPYHNDNLTKETMLWLIDLANKNLNWHFNAIQEFEYGCRVCPGDSFNDSFYIEFPTGHMYSDFGCVDYHFLSLRDKIDVTNIKKQRNYADEEYCFLTVPYSGKSQCMICGDTSNEVSDEAFLACDNCLNYHTCDCCGDRFGGEMHYVGEDCVCSYCYDERVHCCNSCREEHLDDDMTSIVVLPRLNEMHQKALRNEFFHTHWGGIPSHELNVKLEDSDNVEMTYNIERPNARVCKNDKCLNKWIESHLLPGKRPHWRTMRWIDELCVFYDELNDETQKSLASSNENYINYLARYFTPTPTKRRRDI